VATAAARPHALGRARTLEPHAPPCKVPPIRVSLASTAARVELGADHVESRLLAVGVERSKVPVDQGIPAII
jgi:hypothetical protein